jgi:amidohydrolase
VKEELLRAVQALHPGMVAVRRDLHMHPEVLFDTARTAGLVARTLREAGLQVQEGVGRSGVVGLLRGALPGPVVALRADIDALAIGDRKSVPYRSTVEGAAHLCGHDAHTAMALAVARILAAWRDRLPGTVKFIFQPAEEAPSGGARAMIADGVLQEPRVERIFGLHVWPDLPVGTVGLQDGPTMAASDFFYLTITGKGGHAAMPHLSIDAVAVAAQAITALQQIVSRQVDPFDPVVLTLGMIRGGERPNAIAHDVTLGGSVRTLNDETRRLMPERIRQIVRGVTEAYGATFDLDYHWHVGPTVNEPVSTAMAERAGRWLLGPDRVVRLERPSMAGEDFSHFLREVPGCYFKVGCANPAKLPVYPLHHPLFDLDEDAMTAGALTAAGAILHALGLGPGGDGA